MSDTSLEWRFYFTTSCPGTYNDDCIYLEPLLPIIDYKSIQQSISNALGYRGFGSQCNWFISNENSPKANTGWLWQGDVTNPLTAAAHLCSSLSIPLKGNSAILSAWFGHGTYQGQKTTVSLSSGELFSFVCLGRIKTKGNGYWYPLWITLEFHCQEK